MREIDASFTAEAMPPNLSEARARIVECLKPPRGGLQLKSNSFKIQWYPRGEPRVPAAVAAFGTVAKDLARKLLASDQTKWESWKGVATSDTTVLLGEAESLPWVDGVSYLGSDERAPRLLLPTDRDPNVPLDLLSLAFFRKGAADHSTIGKDGDD